MRRWSATILVVTLTTLATPLTVLAQTQPVPLGRLLATSDLLRFEIVLGRVVVRDACHGKAITETREDKPDQVAERLSLRVSDGHPRVRYELDTPESRYTYYFYGDDCFSMERHPCDETANSLRYEQRCAKQDVVLVVVQNGSESTYSAPSLWHLWLKHPEICELELAPCLSVLRSSWRLGRTVADLESHLFGDDVSDDSQALYAKWVLDLSHPRFGVRQRAFENLCNEGVQAKAFLDSLEVRKLDGEQRHRIRSLRKALCFQSEDTVDRLASWLTADRRVWFGYLSDPNKARRQQAHRELKQLCGDAISFDPEAPAEDRATQISNLQTRLFR